MSAPTKPKGILYITILYLAIAAILVVLAILCFAPGASRPTLLQDLWYNSISPSLPSIGDNTIRGLFNEYVNPYVTGWGVACIIVGGIVAIVAVMLFQMKVWGRNLAMLIALPLIVILLGLIVLWYLFKDDVKAAFSPPAEPAPKKRAKQ